MLSSLEDPPAELSVLLVDDRWRQDEGLDETNAAAGDGGPRADVRSPSLGEARGQGEGHRAVSRRAGAKTGAGWRIQDVTHPPTEEKITWRWWIFCLVAGHDYQPVPGRRYLKMCRRCGRLEAIRPPDE
jgi:hypothetical protein